MNRSVMSLLGALAILAGVNAHAAVKGHDYPLVGRFQGSKIVKYQQQAFDEYSLIVKKITRGGGIAKNAGSVEKVDGKITRITYQTDKSHSTLEVLLAYQDKLKANGFNVLFKCSNAACGGYNFDTASPGYRVDYLAFSSASDQRYLAARLRRSSGDVYVSIDINRATGNGGPTHDAIFTQVDVVEVKPRTSKVVVIKAAQMARSIKRTGRVALRDIYFDTNKTTLKPTSKPALKQVAKLLKDHPDLKLLVVGYTDSQGKFDYNITLSKRRAAAVVKALVDGYGIDRHRLKPWGDGDTAPVASNDSSAGRAKNRRVELVKQ